MTSTTTSNTYQLSISQEQKDVVSDFLHGLLKYSDNTDVSIHLTSMGIDEELMLKHIEPFFKHFGLDIDVHNTYINTDEDI